MKDLKNLAAKMILVMKKVSYIQKNGQNTFQNYKYATESAVSAKVSEALEEAGIFMFTSILSRESQQYSTRGGKSSFLITVKIQVTFIDADTGEQFVIECYGDGSDSDDKGVYKAITGAQKYALMKTFLIATGDDPEKDDEKDKKTVDRYIEKMNSCLTRESLTTTWKEFSSKYPHLKSVLAEHAKRCAKILEEMECGKPVHPAEMRDD